MEQIDVWSDFHGSCDVQMQEILPQLNRFIEEQGEQGDEMFRYFAGALKDWTAYEMSYLAIRSGNWKMRNAGKPFTVNPP